MWQGTPFLCCCRFLGLKTLHAQRFALSRAILANEGGSGLENQTRGEFILWSRPKDLTLLSEIQYVPGLKSAWLSQECRRSVGRREHICPH